MRYSENPTPHLESAFWNTRWETSELTALCLPGGDPEFWKLAEHHEAPNWDCNCGLFAFSSLSTLQKNVTYRSTLDSQDKVAAAVICSGKVIVHGLEGMRAQRQRIVALAKARHDGTPDLSPLLVKYDLVEVQYEDLIRYASKFGKQVS
jgi:hypothetical protein